MIDQGFQIVVGCADRMLEQADFGGHNLPQQAPHAFVEAVLEVRDWLLLERKHG